MSLFCPANSVRRSAIIDDKCHASNRTAKFSHEFSRTLAPDLSELRGKFGQRGVEISDEAIVRNLENRRFLVFIDGDDDLRILHPREMLNRARNADRDIEF